MAWTSGRLLHRLASTSVRVLRRHMPWSNGVAYFRNHGPRKSSALAFAWPGTASFRRTPTLMFSVFSELPSRSGTAGVMLIDLSGSAVAAPPAPHGAHLTTQRGVVWSRCPWQPVASDIRTWLHGTLGSIIGLHFTYSLRCFQGTPLPTPSLWPIVATLGLMWSIGQRLGAEPSLLGIIWSQIR